MSQNKGLAFGQAVLNTARGTDLVAWTPYAALCVGDPRAAGVEVTYTGYYRALITFGDPGAQSSMSNTNTLVWTAPAEVMTGAPTWVGIYDDWTAGTLRWALPIPNPPAWVIGAAPTIAIGALIVGEL